MAGMEVKVEEQKQQQQLLLDTLNRLWTQYLQASEKEDAASVKDHWLWLLLYNFQFLDEVALNDAWLTSHFNLLPEELCSYLLEQVYQIISEAKRSQSSSSQEQEPEQQDKCIKQLRKQHNLAQLILSTPSDCNKILALRTFLTDKLGHHLLTFLLRVDVKHIASQKSLCQLCINLFPNCKWSPANEPLAPLTSISQFLGSFYLAWQTKKPRRQQQQHQKSQLNQQKTNSIIDNFEDFRMATKSSDDLALLLIQLLTRCVDAEQESQLSVTVHNFALGHLCAASLEEEEQDNDEIIKFELLQLIARCVNNFYMLEQQQPNVHDFNSNFGQLLYALTANRRSPLLAHGVLYIMFGSLHNLVDNNGVRDLNHIDVRNFDACFEVLQEAAAESQSTSTSILFLHIYKLLLRLTDNLSRQEQHLQSLMESSTSTTLPPHKQQQQQHTHRHHKRQRSSQLHCLGAAAGSLSCYFQGKLYHLLPSLEAELQEHSVRSLLRTGSCCCHYNARNFATCLRLATQLSSSSYQKCAYKFLHYNVLHTIFVKRAPPPGGCPSCEEKLKSPGFHLDLLSIYKENYKPLFNTPAMLLFLKHLKHIAYLLSFDLAAGILAEVALPIFRQHKELIESRDQDPKRNSKLSPLQLPSKLDHYRALHECLSIFVMYMSDIRLVKAFYNEENIRYMQDLLVIPELQRGVCDLIKVGIDNIAFLGENSQEQITLSRRLIQLQLNSSDKSSQLFQSLLFRCSKNSRTKFWLDEACPTNSLKLEGHKPADILYITALQWTLNFELLKTSQLFYNEFAKIYSIPVEIEDEEEVESPAGDRASELPEEMKLRHGDKNIIDILKLNYNALGCFLMLPKAAMGATTSTATTTPTAGICNSSSLETLLVSQLPLGGGATSVSVSLTTAASSDYADSSLDYASVIDSYSRDTAAAPPSFLEHLRSSEPRDESIVLFDIRGSSQQDPTSTSSLISLPNEEEVASADGLINKLFNIVGSIFGGTSSGGSSPGRNSPTSGNIEADLLCLYEPNGECKKLFLKLFEATMAICIKGFQNEEVEKMQKHLRKLRAIILSHASDNWPEHGEQHARDNSVIQTLQTLLKIAELSSSHQHQEHGAGVVVSSPSRDDSQQQPRPRARSFNSGSGVELPRLLQPVKLPAKNSLATPPTPRRRPNSSELNGGAGGGVDADYFSTRASLSCAADSELELSENEHEFYLTADEGYEADGEIADLSESEECELNGGVMAANESWTPFQPSSRYRSHIMHQGLSQLVVQMLAELSQLCMKQPNGWTESLTQLANRLFVIRDYLGGPLCLLRGFAPILSCSDPRLRELQQSLLELITHLNTPEILQCYYSILASRQPPVELLMRHMHHISAGSLRKAQPCMELEFPIATDGKIVITSEPLISEQIERVRLHHQQCQTSTLFTRAACIFPVTQTRLWQPEGLTVSLWMELRGQHIHRNSMQFNDDDTRYSGEDLTKLHLLSLGTNQAMISIYISHNMQLIFELVKPNEQLQSPVRVEEHMDASAETASVISANTQAAANGGSIRQALKQTKLALLNSFGQMHLLNGHQPAAADSSGGYFEGSAVQLQHLRLPRHKWMHLVFGLQQLQGDALEISIFLDGLEQHTMRLPFHNLRQLTRVHSFQMLALGEGQPTRSSPGSNSSSSRSTLDGSYPRYALSNVILFRRRLLDPSLMMNLTAMGPDFTEFTQCQVANWKPNYGFCSLGKLASSNFGNHADCMRQLRQARVLVYTAQQPDLVMSYDASQELDMACYGQPHGHMLYGELLQHQPQTLQAATSLSGGLSTLLYLFARVVELSGNASTQALALDLLLQVAHSDAQLYTEFQRQDYLALIGYVIKSEKCSKDVQLLRSIVNNACSQVLITRKGESLHVNDNTMATLVYPRLVLAVLQRYSDWHRSGATHSDVLDMLFRSILALTRDKHPQRDFNMEQLQKSGLLVALLNLCKVYVIESPSPVQISPYAAECFVQILAVFAGSPPDSSMLDEIMKLLLLLHKPSECYVTHDRAHFYFLLTAQQPAKERSLVATNLSRVTTSLRRQLNPHPQQPPELLDPERAERIKKLRRLHTSSSAYRKAINDFEEQLEQMADCSNLNKTALRLLSPVEATRWRLKFKRRHPTNTNTGGSPKRSPLKIARRRIHPMHLHLGKTWQPSGHSTPSSAGQLSLPNRKTDFYDQPGIIRLQQRLLILLKDFLCLLPDSAVDVVTRHYVKLELLLVLANQRSCAVRQAVIQLLEVLTKRLASGELNAATKSLYSVHLANQLTIHGCDTAMFEACLAWTSGVHGSLTDMLAGEAPLRIRQRFGLQALLAIAEGTEPPQEQRVFKALLRVYLQNPDDQSCLIESGLLQCSVKALFKIYSLRLGQPNADESIVELLASIGERALRSVGQINLVWDILNLLVFYQDKQPQQIMRSFRTVQAQLQLEWLTKLFEPNSFRLPSNNDSALSPTELRTRVELLIDRCTQFFTVGTTGPSYVASSQELALFQLLVSYGIASNQRCNNFIAWGLQPSRPRDLRSYIVDALWRSQQQDEFQRAIICDGKMIKALLWLSLLEDIPEPIENLQRLCDVLGIKESDSSWNLVHELDRLDQSRNNMAAKQKTLLEKTIYKYEPLVQHCIESSMVTTRKVAELQNAERKALMCHMKVYDDTYTYTKWLEIIRRMTHEGAPWHCAERAESSWELDDTEGPSRVHTRLRRCHLDIDRRFFMQEYRQQGKGQREDLDVYMRPLDYLISSYDQQLNISLNSQILYNFAAKFLPVDGEIEGEIIITDLKLYFLATYRCRYFNVNCDIANITEIWLKRYQHQETAFEILLDTNKSLFFSLQNADDWKIMREVFCDKIVATPDQAKVLAITQQWREGLLTNWEYLMTLNQIAGRTYNDLMQYPVFPWVLANYSAEILDLREEQNFRRLGRPIAVQVEENEMHYISNYMYIDSTNTTMGSMILKPYHYSSHYSNSGTVLHFLVRVPPFTSYFLRYQDNDFDLPDRTFHALNTTWLLASRDSPTDVKELIPEFFCLPEMFDNFERFNFGLRQNGERVEGVALPPWCQRDSRLFVLIHRQALESEMVRNQIHNWIDLIYGYKQSGESAVEAINVFHPATYAVFLDSEISDPIEREAVKTMVKTYGQMPRQLFKSPHPATKALDYALVDKPIVSTVRGLRWGVYVGSPQLKPPSWANIHKIPGTEHLVSFSNTNVVYALPARASVMQGAEPDTYNVISWGYDDRIVRIQPLNKPQAKPKNLLHNGTFDDITACGCDVNSNQLWFGHKSGRVSVYKCAGGLDAAHHRASAKGRQSYVRGFSLSYNSAFRKMTSSKGMIVGGCSERSDEAGGGLNATHSASSVNSSSSNSFAGDALQQRDGADLTWIGPTLLVRHTDEITCIALSVEFKIAVTAGRDGIAVIWDLNDWSYVRTIARPAEIHQSPITHVAISPTLGDIVTVHTLPAQPQSPAGAPAAAATRATTTSTSTAVVADECFEVTEENLDDFVNVNVNPNGKSILRLHSVNARYVQHLVHEDRIMAVCYSYIKEGVGVNVIATAVEGGFVRFWSSWNLSFVSELTTGTSPIRSICYSTHQHLVVLTRESHIQVWESEGLYGNAPKFPQIVYK